MFLQQGYHVYVRENDQNTMHAIFTSFHFNVLNFPILYLI